MYVVSIKFLFLKLYSSILILFCCDLFYCSTRWKSNEFSLGSYTAIGVGSSQLDIEHIARPMHVNNNTIVSNKNSFMCL